MKRKTVAKLKQDLQKVFNTFIRKRDQGKPCITCGQIKTLQAGHFFAVSTHDGLRFDDDNVHGECASCNCFNESHLIYYNENLKERIGTTRYNDLMKRAEDYKSGTLINEYYFNGKWDRKVLEYMIGYYKEKLKEID